MPPTQNQSSFIPRKPLTSDPTLAPQRGPGFFTVTAFVVLFLAIVSAGFAYGYENYLKGDVDSKKELLLKAKGAFEPEIVLELQTLGNRIAVAKSLLATHPAPTVLFSELGKATLQTVQFTKLAYAVKDVTGSPRGALTLEGRAQTFSAVALQSDEFAKSKIFKNPIFTNIIPLETGGVTFRVALDVDLEYLKYEKTVQTR